MYKCYTVIVILRCNHEELVFVSILDLLIEITVIVILKYNRKELIIVLISLNFRRSGVIIKLCLLF